MEVPFFSRTINVLFAFYVSVCFYYTGNNDSLKPITSMPLRKTESAAASEADGFMKRLQILKMKASREETYGASNGECNGNNRLDEDSQDEDLPMLNTSRSPRK